MKIDLNLSPRLKGIYITSGAVLFCLLLGGLFWFLLRPLGLRNLGREVNRALEADGRNLVLGEGIGSSRGGDSASLISFWYRLEGPGGKGFGALFPLYQGPMAGLYLCVVDRGGKAGELIPISGNALHLEQGLPQEIKALYRERVERSFRKLPREATQ